jgi:uroporphyrinogen decarboxylase
MDFAPDYRNMLSVMFNERPNRLPLYEHIISPHFMERVTGTRFAELENEPGVRAKKKFFKHYCAFWRDMTYDTISYEVPILMAMPDSGAIMGGRPGPIQNRADFEAYPWEEIPERYWSEAGPRFDALAVSIPPGMGLLGGVGNGVFEVSEDLVGFEYLSYMVADDPGLVRDLFRRIGDLMVELWAEFLERYEKEFLICRFGDDLGFKTSTLISPKMIRDFILPEYRRIISLIHSHGKPFIWHSCGCVFSIMDDVLDLGIQAKHSNEDAIAPFEEWITRYGRKIGLLGGIDVDILCRCSPDEIYEIVVERGSRYREMARGFALGSGNSIPDYVPVEGYLAMVRAGQAIRGGNHE